MEALYAQTSRERFVPFVRLCLGSAFLIDAFSLAWDYFSSGNFYFPGLRLLIISFYLVLLGSTFIRPLVQYIHVIAVISVVGVVYFLAFLASLSGVNFERFLPMFFIPLQLVPVMSSMTAAMATLWLSLFVIFDAAQRSGMPENMLETTKVIFAYYIFISACVTYVATQYRRSSFLMEKNLEQARLEAEAANEAKSTFLATMSHEVRTPLNGILGLLTLMKDTRLDKQQKDYVETIRYSGETLLTILNDILDFSKMEAGKFDIEEVSFNVERLVHSVVTLMKSRAEEKGLEFDYKINPDVPTHIKSDPTRLRQILLNLTGNAIKFTNSGFVHVHVAARNVEKDTCVISFEVSDTGIGISEEAQKKLFQEFAQADSSISRKYGGTGLGLAICRKIVELMKGEIGIISKEGQGSTFWFEVPATIAVAAREQSEEMASIADGEMPAMRPIHVLVAEDNKVNQKVITGLLERCGHAVTIAENGAEALEKLKPAFAPFDLVLMDMQMPVMDGLSAASAIRKLENKQKSIPIIALTANTVKGDEQRCLAAGMNGYVSKPIDPGALYTAMSMHVPDAVIPGETQKQSMQMDRYASNPNFENLSKLEQMMGAEYVKKFTEDGLKEVDGLINVVCAGSDAREMRRAAHDLKSLSDMLGLNDVQALAEGIEMCCAEDSKAEALVLGKMLKDRYIENVSDLRDNYLSAI